MSDFPLKKWETAGCDANDAVRLAEQFALPLPVASVMASRGLHEPEAAHRYLNPRLSELGDPLLLPDMPRAADRIWAAADHNEKIVIFGDYDVDGVCSSALLVSVFSSLGFNVSAFLPNRLQEGYGLSTQALARCIQEESPQLLITVDCGTGSLAAVEMAGKQNIDVIVTDHHEPSDDGVAGALAVVNPKLGSDEPAKLLAGVGVAFKLCHAVVKVGLRQQRKSAASLDLREFLDLVAIGTVADMVPLHAENRILSRRGLDILNENPRLGIAELLRCANVRSDLDAYHIGYVIGPRLNAAGRLGDARTSLELLLCTDLVIADELARQLEADNLKRKKIESDIHADAVATIESQDHSDEYFGIAVGKKGWHQGAIGIVASRLCAKLNRPTMVIGFNEDGTGRGSCRSIAHLDILEALADCEDLLSEYGGHRMAAGVSVEHAALDALVSRFNAACKARLAGRDLRPVQTVDAWVTLSEVDRRLFEAVKRMQPLGVGNRAPVWGVREITLAGPPRTVGKEKNHWKFTVTQGGSSLEAVAFNMGHYAIPEGKLDVLFEVRQNAFRGRNALELHILDLGPSSST